MGSKQEMNKTGQRLIYLPIFAFAFIVLITALADFYVDRLWFSHYGALAVFNVQYFARILAGTAFFIPFLILMYANLFVLRKSTGNASISAWFLARIQLQHQSAGGYKLVRALPVLVPGALALLLAFEISAHWQDFLLWLHAETGSGISDPVFGRDLSFFFFILPVRQLIVNRLLLILFLLLTYSGLWYIASGDIAFGRNDGFVSRRARAHLLVLGSLFAAVWALFFHLSAYDVVYSSGTRFHGAGYTAVHILFRDITLLPVFACC
jgi:uncharacterized membrane protein (UPF0182 family)